MPFKTLNTKNFFNREGELDILSRIAAQALAGDAGDIYLSGKWGIGKTELLRHLYSQLFWKHSDVIPFYYEISESFNFAEEFARDYLRKYILQSIAFQKKAPSIVDAEIYSLGNLLQFARSSDAGWASETINSYLRAEKDANPVNMLIFAISVPYRCYLDRGMPSVVMIDDFHKTKKLCTDSKDGKKNLWTHFERSIKSRYTPHIFTGLQTELDRMFFEETSFGEHLELFRLEGLDKNASAKLFRSLCELYGLNAEHEVFELLDRFSGNPFYIKSFIQSARQNQKKITGDNFQDIYLREITEGKIYKYWTTKLRAYVPAFSLRRPSLDFLYHLSEQAVDIDLSTLRESLSVDVSELDQIINLLQASGTVVTGFSLPELADDVVLSDLLKKLYLREVKRQPAGQVSDMTVKEQQALPKRKSVSSFDLNIPFSHETGLVAIKSFQHIAQYLKVPAASVAQIQVAMVELLRNILPGSDGYNLSFTLQNSRFSIEITVAHKGFVMSEDDRDYILEYIDDISVETMEDGTKIILTKELRSSFAETVEQ